LVFVWVNFGDSQILFGTQAGRKNVPVRYNLSVAIRCRMLRRKEDGKLKAVKNISSTKRKIISWMLCGLELFPWPFWGLFSLLRKFWALFLEFFGLRWALHSRSFVRRPLVPRFYKVSTMALPGDTSSSSVSVLGTTIGNHIQAPRFVGSCRCLWASWTMGIFFGSAKAEFRIWKFLTIRCTNHVRDDKYQ